VSLGWARFPTVAHSSGEWGKEVPHANSKYTRTAAIAGWQGSTLGKKGGAGAQENPK
jgi:hypothetical protein